MTPRNTPKKVPYVPATLTLIAEALAEALDVPRGTVEVTQHTQGNGWVVGVMLAYDVADTGDGESGPCVTVSVSRWLEVTPPSPGTRHTAWVADVYDVAAECEGDSNPWGVDPVARIEVLGVLGDAGPHTVVAGIVRTLRALGVAPVQA